MLNLNNSFVEPAAKKMKMSGEDLRKTNSPQSSQRAQSSERDYFSVD